jgi:hypothetical protein
MILVLGDLAGAGVEVTMSLAICCVVDPAAVEAVSF